MSSKFPSWPARLGTECRDVLELIVLPGLAAVLPWRFCFWVFKRLARIQCLYREPCEAALLQARVRGWAGEDEAHWIWVRRLVTLVDHADHYLGLWRSDAWMKRHMTVQGTWPEHQNGLLLLTFHWGAGFWGLRHAGAHGLQPHALVASLGSQAYEGRTVLSWYASSRNRHVARCLGSPTIDVAQQLKHVIRALRKNHSLLGVLDVPADEVKASIGVNVLGMNARVPRGLLRLAVDQKVPVVLYVTGLDTATGLRHLVIHAPVVYTDVDDMAAGVFIELEKIIAQDSPAWHFWAVADRFFSPPTPI